MAYNPVGQYEQTYYHDPRPFAQDYELRSTAPSFTSYKSSFISQTSTAQGDTYASSDHQHLLQRPPAYQIVPGSKWNPGFWRQFPWLAISSLLGVLASTVASVVILTRSHKKPLDEWGYGIAPSVYLAIASVIANALTAYAITSGLEITFWRNALQGRTLASLNQNWLNGHNLYNALAQGYRSGGRITAIACIFSVIALLRGPIFQRASAVQSGVAYGTAGTLQLAVAQKLPQGYTGLAVDSRATIAEVGRLSPTFAEVMQEYSTRHNISFPHAECGGSCTASVIGFGFNTSCSFTEYKSEKASTQAFDQAIFVSNTSLYPIGKRAEAGTWYEDMGIQFNVTYRFNQTSRQTTDANGTYLVLITHLRSHICNVTGGSVEYKVRLSSQTISLASNRDEDRFIQPQVRGVLAGPGTQYHHSTIGGFEYASSYMYTSSALSLFRGARSSISLKGSLANEMIRGVSIGTSNETFDDPMSDMLDGIREIAFRTAVRAGKDQPNNVTDAQQTVKFKGEAIHSIYITDFIYMYIAKALSVLSVLATSLLFYGWWELGRTVSLSPVEIAKAFDAPILIQVGSNVGLADNRNLGPAANVRLQYGVRADELGYGGGQMMGQRRRLVVGQAGWVGRPEKGVVYE